MISASKLEEAFPVIDPGLWPKGANIIVQLRTVREKTASGLVLVEDTRTFNKANTQMAKVIRLGPIAYCNRETGIPWPEGVWVRPGDLVRVPKWGGDRFERKISGTDDTAIFCIFSDHEIKAQIDPAAFEEIDEII
jgi:co-chaperonin GroES (HSP10)